MEDLKLEYKISHNDLEKQRIKKKLEILKNYIDGDINVLSE
jgi:hypothetical protein